MTERRILVIGCKGSGSAIAEACLVLGNLPYDREEVDYEQPGAARDRLAALNPLVQVPTLVLPDGAVLTETLAIAVYVHLHAPDAALIPKSEDAQVRFWRWASFLIGAVYPTFTYGDDPSKWVKHPEGSAELRASTDEWRKKLLGLLEGACSAPYFLGDVFSVIDLYLTVMSHWRPRPAWFVEHAPKVMAVSAHVRRQPALAELWARHLE
jgi:GST-like protein